MRARYLPDSRLLTTNVQARQQYINPSEGPIFDQNAPKCYYFA